MEWYVPITILPSIGMLILSTTGQMMNLSSEIGTLLSKNCDEFQHRISSLKIRQLTRLTRAATFLYASAACFVLSGIVIFQDGILGKWANYILIFGIGLILLALILLIIYGFNTIKIRKLQHLHSLKSYENKI